MAPRVFFTGASFEDYCFDVEVGVHFETPKGAAAGSASVSGEVLVSGEWGESASQAVTLQPGQQKVNVNVTATAAQVRETRILTSSSPHPHLILDAGRAVVAGADGQSEPV